MKQKYKKAIHSQARRLEKLTRDIKSIKRGRRVDSGQWYHYSRMDRRIIMENNSDNKGTYAPTNLKMAVRGMSDIQKATIMRALLAKVLPWSVHGNFYHVKKSLCNLAFSK